MAVKCSCGYECRFPGEAEALAQYGCAKTQTRREGPFGSFQLVQCSQDDKARQGTPELPPLDDGAGVKEAFLKKYEKKGNPEDPRKQ